MTKGGKKTVKPSGRGNEALPSRKIRFIVTDRYATESSSDDDDYDHRRPSNGTPPRPRRYVCERILYDKKDDEISQTKGSSRQNRTTLKEYPGARLRRWGRWGAEIRDPLTKRRVWLGSYDTPSEASQAYLAKQLEYSTARREQEAAEACINLSQQQTNQDLVIAHPNKVCKKQAKD